MHRFKNYFHVIFLVTAFLIGLALISNAMTQHDSSTVEETFAQMSPIVDPNVAKLPMYQTGDKLGSGIVASPRMAAYAMELAQHGAGVEFAFQYGDTLSGMPQSHFMEMTHFNSFEMKG